MRTGLTGDYYDQALLDNPLEAPASAFDGSISTRRSGSTPTLGEFLGQGALSAPPQAAGTSTETDGGISELFPEFSRNNAAVGVDSAPGAGSNMRTVESPEVPGNDVRPSGEDSTREQMEYSADAHCDVIGPGSCSWESEPTETRTMEEIEKDLWTPGDVSRSVRTHWKSHDRK